MQNQAMDIESPQNSLSQTVKKIDSYIFKWEDKIGQGNFSQVYSGIHQTNKNKVAVKVIKNCSIKSKIAQRLLQHEINILKNVNNPNVIKCYDVFTSINNCYIITQLCEGGDLQKVLKERKSLEEQQISKIIYDTYKGLQYLNQNFIVHRDIKVANIFIHNGSFKIADFGFSIRAKSTFKDIPVGSPIYMSPQGLIGNQYGPKTDVWAFGILIYQLLHGDTPLANCKTQEELRQNILKAPSIRPDLSANLKDFIQKCLQTDVKARIQVAQMKDTHYIKSLLYKYEQSTPFKSRQTLRSTQTSNSRKDDIFAKSYTYDETVSLLHYGRLIHKTLLKYPSQILSKWLLNIFSGLVRAKIVKSNGNSPKTQYQNLKEVISDYHKKYLKQHTKINTYGDIQIDQVLKQIYKLYSKPEAKQFMSTLSKQTELLKQGLSNNKMDVFAKQSQSKIFLTQMK